jgi:hypothetical protein
VNGFGIAPTNDEVAAQIITAIREKKRAPWRDSFDQRGSRVNFRAGDIE